MKKRILLLCVFCITLGFTYAQTSDRHITNKVTVAVRTYETETIALIKADNLKKAWKASYIHVISVNPQTNLKAFMRLEKLLTEAERTDFIRGIRSQTDKLDFLFQALVKTSRLETGVIQLDKKPGRLFDTVAQAMSGIVYAAEKKEIAVSVDCPEDL